uniref:Alpha-tubulin N-acetyltransferase n=1 Tax=Panagrolaimus sp. JU765 TaxID=591449 RepID=A0AC34RHD1_9BILA
MNVAYDLSKVFEENPIERLDQSRLRWITPRKYPEIVRAIDRCGEASAKVQKLRKPVTSYDKILDSPDLHVLYIFWEQNGAFSKIIGYLKISKRKLYLRNVEGCQFIVEPICVLDFFVFEEFQRKGFGKALFDRMLEKEQVTPEKLAFDKPTLPLLNFLDKHYNLTNPVWQATSFAVFPEFFRELAPEVTKESNFERKKQGSRPMESMVSNPRVPFQQRPDMAGNLIHGRGPAPTRVEAGPDTPRGRKNTRDFGHSNIFD